VKQLTADLDRANSQRDSLTAQIKSIEKSFLEKDMEAKMSKAQEDRLAEAQLELKSKHEGLEAQKSAFQMRINELENNLRFTQHALADKEASLAEVKRFLESQSSLKADTELKLQQELMQVRIDFFRGFYSYVMC
jgi:hypothetical protein